MQGKADRNSEGTPSANDVSAVKDTKVSSSSQFTISAPLATVLVALIAFIGGLAAHFATSINTRQLNDKELSLKKLEIDNNKSIESSKQSHAENMAERTFVRDIIMKTLEKGTEKEQIRALKAYAKIKLIGKPYAEALLSLNDEDLPTVSPPGFYKTMDELSTLEKVRYRSATASVGLFVGKYALDIEAKAPQEGADRPARASCAEACDA